MILQKQLIRHDPENGQWGDCWRTCIACLLDLPAAEVPNFVGDACLNRQDQSAADAAARTWLKERGYNIVKFCMNAAPEYANAAKDWFDDTPYIMTGQSAGLKGIAHCVIGQGPFLVLWDVAPGGSGLAGPWRDEFGQDVYWLEFIVPCATAKPALAEAA